MGDSIFLALNSTASKFFFYKDATQNFNPQVFNSTKTAESRNDSRLTHNSQMETESLSDLNVQRQYYYCKPDDERQKF